MSLRPKLHVSTFHWRTVVSMIGRLCHLFVHALSSLQVANAQCMTLRSLAPCLRAAREKHRFAAGKKHRNGKKHVWQQEKNALQREKAISAAGKTPAKNAASQREKFKAAEKTPCSSTKAPLQQKKCILEAAGKNRPRREKPVRGKKKTGRGRKKTSSRESPALQPKKLPQRKKYISATGKSSSPLFCGCGLGCWRGLFCFFCLGEFVWLPCVLVVSFCFLFVLASRLLALPDVSLDWDIRIFCFHLHH